VKRDKEKKGTGKVTDEERVRKNHSLKREQRWSHEGERKPGKSNWKQQEARKHGKEETKKNVKGGKGL